MAIQEISPISSTNYTFSTYNSISNIEPNKVIQDIVNKNNVKDDSNQTNQNANLIKDYSTIVAVNKDLNLQTNYISNDIQNLNDSIIPLQIAQNAQTTQSQLLDNTKEDLIQLSTQSLSQEEKEDLVEDIQNNLEKFDEIASTTTYNQQTLLQANNEDTTQSEAININFANNTFQTTPLQSNTQAFELEDLKDIETYSFNEEQSSEYIQKIDNALQTIQEDISSLDDSLSTIQTLETKIIENDAIDTLSSQNTQIVSKEQIINDSINFSKDILAEYAGSLSQSQSNVSSIDESILLSDEITQTNNIQFTTQSNNVITNENEENLQSDDKTINTTNQTSQIDIQNTSYNNTTYENEFYDRLEQFRLRNNDEAFLNKDLELPSATNNEDDIEVQTQNNTSIQTINEDKKTPELNEIENEIAINNQILANNVVQNNAEPEQIDDVLYNTLSDNNDDSTTSSQGTQNSSLELKEIENTTDYQISPALIAQNSKDFTYQMLLAQAGSLTVAQMNITLLQTNRLLEDDDN